MRLTGTYRIEVTGDIDRLGVGYSHEAIGYLFQRLLTGDEAVMENLENLGIRVTVVDDEFVRIPRLENDDDVAAD